MGQKNEMRRHYRKNALIIAEYTTSKGSFQGVLTDISAGGLFIRTVNIPAVGQAVSLEFSLFSFNKTISASGSVIRIDANGFAVSFDKAIEILDCKEDNFPSLVSEFDR
jgi:Tfp pilus assembly protein PilZ